MQSEDPTSIFTLLISKFRQSKRKTENTLSESLRKLIYLQKKKANRQNKGSEQKDFETKQKSLETLAQVKSQLVDLKKNLSHSFEDQNYLYGECRKKVHIDPEVKENKKDEMNKAIINFFASQKKLRIAQTINSHQKYEGKNIELQLFQEAFRISENILQNRLKPLKQWCYDHSHALPKVRTSLEFKMSCCEYLNLLQNDNHIKAVQFLRKAIGNLILSEIEKKQLKKLTMLILIDKEESKKLLQKNLEKTNEIFLSTFEKVYNFSFLSKFEKSLNFGISILKTISCHDQIKQPEENSTVSCPICSPPIQQLVNAIPMLQKNQSSLICKINGSVMDDKNYPIVLPDGHVYSLSGLQETGTQTKFICPRTGKKYMIHDCQKLFIS